MEKYSQPVWQFRADGTFVRKVRSMRKAAQLIGSYTPNIKAACEVHIKVKGFYWRYAEGEHPLKIQVPPRRRGGKQVLVYKMLNKNKLKEPVLCHSIGEAARFSKVSESSIRAICQQKRENYRDEYIFKFVNGEDKINILPQFEIYKQRFKRKVPLSNTPVKLTHVETGKEYKFTSINEAARELQISDKGIRHVLANRYRQTKGYLVEKISTKIS